MYRLLYINWFNLKKKYSYWGWSICKAMTEQFLKLVSANSEYNKIHYKDNDEIKYQIIHERLDENNKSGTSSKDHVVYKNEIILYNRYKDYKDYFFR